MKYMLLIYTSPEQPDLPPEQAEAEMGKWYAYTEALASSGALIAGDPLQPPATATTVTVREGKRLLTDGPFAETKEALMGYYVVECATLDEALDWAEQVPASPYGAIEVRPLMTFDAPA